VDVAFLLLVQSTYSSRSPTSNRPQGFEAAVNTMLYLSAGCAVYAACVAAGSVIKLTMGERKRPPLWVIPFMNLSIFLLGVGSVVFAWDTQAYVTAGMMTALWSCFIGLEILNWYTRTFWGAKVSTVFESYI
jgi:hypothetical protein